MSEQANKIKIGPIIKPGFLAVLDHSGEEKRKSEQVGFESRSAKKLDFGEGQVLWSKGRVEKNTTQYWTLSDISRTYKQCNKP